MATKLFFLHNNLEFKVNGVLGGRLDFDEKWLTKSPVEITNLYDVVTIDVDKYKNWYAQNRRAISLNPAWKTIFMHPQHATITAELKAILVDEWKVDSVLKEIPKEYIDRNDLIQKILSGHLASVVLPIAESCFMSIYLYLKNRL